MVAQVYRNDSQEMWRCIKHLINVSLPNNNYNSCYQASVEFVLPLPYEQPVVLPPVITPA